MFKKWGTIALGSALALSLAACDSSADKTSTETKSEPKQEQTKKETKKEEKKKISLADYEAIKSGDSLTGEGGESYEDIVKKFGEPNNKSESQAGDMKMLMAGWSKNINGDLGANFNLTFIEKDGVKRVTSKSQMGMK